MTTKHGSTPLTLASTLGHERVGHLLVTAGAAVNAVGFNSLSPIGNACRSLNPRMVRPRASSTQDYLLPCTYHSQSRSNCALLTTHYSLLTAQHYSLPPTHSSSVLTAHCSALTTHYSTLNTQPSRPTTHSSLLTHQRSALTTHDS